MSAPARLTHQQEFIGVESAKNPGRKEFGAMLRIGKDSRPQDKFMHDIDTLIACEVALRETEELSRVFGMFKSSPDRGGRFSSRAVTRPPRQDRPRRSVTQAGTKRVSDLKRLHPMAWDKRDNRSIDNLRVTVSFWLRKGNFRKRCVPGISGNQRHYFVRWPDNLLGIAGHFVGLCIFRQLDVNGSPSKWPIIRSDRNGEQSDGQLPLGRLLVRTHHNRQAVRLNINTALRTRSGRPGN